MSTNCKLDWAISECEKRDIVILGEEFYISLFINYNIFKKDIHIFLRGNQYKNKNYWSNQINIKYLNQIEKKEHHFVIYCGISENVKRRYQELIDFDFFDMKSIRENGTFEYKGDTYIVDSVKYLVSAPEYMYRAYKDVVCDNLSSYLKELAKAPARRYVNKKKQIVLFDYEGRYIHQRNGRRVTSGVQNAINRIHVFGDSRVSGFMLEDKALFTNMLQGILNQEKLAYDVINYGIPGRDIERIEYQVKNTKIKKGDFLFVLTGCYEYRDMAYEKQYHFAMCINNINEYCKKTM